MRSISSVPVREARENLFHQFPVLRRTHDDLRSAGIFAGSIATA
jgi:hypothetical protein